MSPDPNLRASDADRERVAAELGDHLAAGRLENEEFQERLSSAYAARTLGELDTLLTDLPAERDRPGNSPAVPLEKESSDELAPTDDSGRPVPARFGTWLSVGLFVTAIWGFSSLASEDLLPFWPIWVIGPWGLALLMHRSRRGFRRRGLPGSDRS
jgi:hypothetical protein